MSQIAKYWKQSTEISIPTLLIAGIFGLWYASSLLGQAVSTTPGQIPFSHKSHADLKIECIYCHEKALTAERAGFPAASKCMVCHAQVAKDVEAIVRLAALAKDAAVKPEKPVYRLPDFVTFSHARHKTDVISCGTCHGNVWASNVIVQQLPMRMKACVDCHKANHSPVTCTTCHELFQ